MEEENRMKNLGVEMEEVKALRTYPKLILSLAPLSQLWERVEVKSVEGMKVGRGEEGR